MKRCYLSDTLSIVYYKSLFLKFRSQFEIYMQLVHKLFNDLLHQ